MTTLQPQHEQSQAKRSGGTIDSPHVYTLRYMDRREQYNRLEQIGHDLLVALGDDVTRPGLQDTPARFARMWQEFVNYEPGNTDTTFEVITTDQMVVVSGIRVWSVCEHHLLPFWCDITIGYIARDKVLGLSKFARIAHKYAHRPQVQERLIHTIADEVMRVTDTDDVAIIASGQHLCMLMRGIKTDATMKTSIMRGVFLDKPAARQEFFALC